MKSQSFRLRLSGVFASFICEQRVNFRRVIVRPFGVALFLVGVLALLCGYVEGVGAVAAAVLTRNDLEEILGQIFTLADEAGDSKADMRGALETICDLADPEVELERDDATGEWSVVEAEDEPEDAADQDDDED